MSLSSVIDTMPVFIRGWNFSVLMIKNKSNDQVKANQLCAWVIWIKVIHEAVELLIIGFTWLTLLHGSLVILVWASVSHPPSWLFLMSHCSLFFPLAHQFIHVPVFAWSLKQIFLWCQLISGSWWMDRLVRVMFARRLFGFFNWNDSMSLHVFWMFFWLFRFLRPQLFMADTSRFERPCSS